MVHFKHTAVSLALGLFSLGSITANTSFYEGLRKGTAYKEPRKMSTEVTGQQMAEAIDALPEAARDKIIQDIANDEFDKAEADIVEALEKLTDEENPGAAKLPLDEVKKQVHTGLVGLEKLRLGEMMAEAIDELSDKAVQDKIIEDIKNHDLDQAETDMMGALKQMAEERGVDIPFDEVKKRVHAGLLGLGDLLDTLQQPKNKKMIQNQFKDLKNDVTKKDETSLREASWWTTITRIVDTAIDITGTAVDIGNTLCGLTTFCNEEIDIREAGWWNTITEDEASLREAGWFSVIKSAVSIGTTVAPVICSFADFC